MYDIAAGCLRTRRGGSRHTRRAEWDRVARSCLRDALRWKALVLLLVLWTPTLHPSSLATANRVRGLLYPVGTCWARRAWPAATVVGRMLTTTPVRGFTAVPKRPVPFKAEATTHLKCSFHYTPLRNGQASTRTSRRQRWGTTASATVRATPANPPEQGRVIEVPEAVEEMKEVIRALGQETNRGIFGVKALKKAALLSVVESLERSNPVPEPTQRMDLLAGDWKLVFSTIVIKGSTRTKLGLREFVSLGDFTQSILPESGTAVNKVDFNVTGLSALSGSLTITAAFVVTGPSRVDIELLEAELAPQQIQRIFEDSFDLLLSVFNPEGWLDITYCDGQMRVGRDDKGNVFVVERR